MADQPLIEVQLSERQANRLVVGVIGELDHGSVGAFLDAVAALRTDGDRHLVLDLSDCTFCDSAGLVAMVRLEREVQDQGGRMILAGSRPNVARTMKLTGLSQLIPCHPTVPDALAALPGDTT